MYQAQPCILMLVLVQVGVSSNALLVPILKRVYELSESSGQLILDIHIIVSFYCILYQLDVSIFHESEKRGECGQVHFDLVFTSYLNFLIEHCPIRIVKRIGFLVGLHAVEGLLARESVILFACLFVMCHQSDSILGEKKVAVNPHLGNGMNMGMKLYKIYIEQLN